MPDSGKPDSDKPASGGLVPPATPVSASEYAALLRSAQLDGQATRHMLPVKAREVRDQGAMEACVSCASAAAMEIRDRQAPTLSAMGHYRTARVDRRLGNSVGRLTVFDGITTLEGAGICSHVLHSAPMTDEGLATPLTAAARTDGRRHLLTRRAFFPGWDTITGGSRAMGIRGHLKDDFPVLMGFRLPRDYPQDFLGPDGVWDDPSIPLTPDGHCVVVIGFNDFKQALCIQDSRGDHEKFEEGCWWMGYAVADSAAIVVAVSLMSRP